MAGTKKIHGLTVEDHTRSTEKPVRKRKKKRGKKKG